MAVFVLPTLSLAAPATYGQDFGLFITNRNQDKPVPRAKALEVLLEFFPEAISYDFDASEGEDVCSLEFMNCEPGDYLPLSELTQKEFLIWFHQLERMNSDDPLFTDHEQTLYHRLWLSDKRNNWIEGYDLTYATMREFLYRYKASSAYYGMAYFDALVADLSELTTDNYKDLYAVYDIQDELFGLMTEIKALPDAGLHDIQILNALTKLYEHYGILVEDIKDANGPLKRFSNIPDHIAEKIKELGLHDVIGEQTYDYSKNKAYRQHNLTVGLSRINGKVYQPGDEIDFVYELGANGDGWAGYVPGYAIVEGHEIMVPGGGLCGSATMLFGSSWKGGLEILERYPHSKYYSSLYPQVGLDATIYRGGKNLRMKNNMDDPILFYVDDDPEKKIITTYLIGNSPFKRIDIEGPIQTGKKEYKMIRRMERFDGTEVVDELDSSYGAVYPY